MYLTLGMLLFVKDIFESKSERVNWYHSYDEQCNLKYSFYMGEGGSEKGILSPLSLYEYGRKVISFSPEVIKFILGEGK